MSFKYLTDHTTFSIDFVDDHLGTASLDALRTPQPSGARGLKLLRFPVEESSSPDDENPSVPGHCARLGQENRHRRPSCDADQVSAISPGKVGSYADTAPQLGVYIDVHHKVRRT